MSVKLSQIAVDELDALLAAYPQAGMPGTVVGVVGRDGQELYLNSSGPNDVSSGEPMRADTVSASQTSDDAQLNIRSSPYSLARRSLLLFRACRRWSEGL